MLIAQLLQSTSEMRICRHAACQHQHGCTRLCKHLFGLLDNALDDGCRVACRHVGSVDLLAALTRTVDEIKGCGLDARERKIGAIPCQRGRRQRKRLGIALVRQLVQRSTAGIRHADHASHLIKRLARSIVARTADLGILGIGIHPVKLRVTARNDKRDKRSLEPLMRQIRRAYVRVNVVDRHKRNIVCKCKGFGKVDAHQQSADQTGICRNSHAIQILNRNACGIKCLFGNARDRLHVCAACNLGHDAAVQTVHVHL